MDKRKVLVCLSQYLPFGLVGINEQQEVTYMTVGKFQEFVEGVYVPYMRPLELLTHEIEYKGERFIPLNRLRDRWQYIKEVGDEGLFYGLDVEFEEGANSEYKITTGIGLEVEEWVEDHRIKYISDNTPYWIVLQLIEWKFDVFGMLGYGKAVPLVDEPSEETVESEEEMEQIHNEEE